MMRKVLIDPGHGGPKNLGAVGAYRGTQPIYEKDLNLSVSLSLADMVEHWMECPMTRAWDDPIGWNDRVALEDEHKPDLVVSVHHNAGPSNGAEIYCTASGGLVEVARVVADAMPVGKGRVIIPTDKTYPRAHWLLQRYRAPVLLVECGYMDNVMDLELCLSESGQIANAAAIALGLAYWNLWECDDG